GRGAGDLPGRRLCRSRHHRRGPRRRSPGRSRLAAPQKARSQTADADTGGGYNPAMDTIALINSYYDAFNRADWEGMLALLTDDVAHDLNQGARETGREAFRTFLARMDRSYSEQLRDITVMAVADGTRAAAEYV